MKKIFLILLFVSASWYSEAQNLEFSNVLLYTGNLTIYTNTSGPIYTVPQGKVWKVESLFSGYVSHLGFKINGILCMIGGFSYSSGLILPIWLDEGDTIQAFILDNAPPNGVGDYYMSIIEFTAP
jgi:hypothetical protein